MWKFVQANEEKTNYSFVLATNSSKLQHRHDNNDKKNNYFFVIVKK